MLARLAIGLLFATSVCSLGVGCVGVEEDVTTDDVGGSVPTGDGTAVEAIVSERQLSGRELPAKTISLTFDDGPGERTSELADFLAENGVKGTFFINGMRVPGRQRAVASVVDRGHLLANHTQHHKQLTKLSPEDVVRELADTDTIMAQVQPEGPWLVRAPFGAWNAKVAQAVNATPLHKYVGSVFWDMGGELTETTAADWDCWGKHVTVERCGELYLQEIRKRGHGIVLMHDIHDKTVDLVKLILPKLIEEGFKFASVEDVPAVKRAIASADTPPAPKQCQSATLGRPVNENGCVQSKSTGTWFRCVESEWYGISGPDGAYCAETFPAAPAAP